ncbi:MAG: 6-carboxytetrahydropterin synthase [Syntrophales bacterium]|nr:6-carboxytetrahydropterin synthase [Syntrophales bacterium]
MYEITIKKTFSAAHTLVIGGEREELHGHNFDVEITVSSATLDSDSVVMDFRHLKRKADEVLACLDHTYLNDIDYFKSVPPTSEQIARFIFERIKKGLPGENIVVSRVSVWESKNAWATYREDDCG